MKCEECGSPDAFRCPTCGRVCCRDHGAVSCPTCGRGVRAGRPAPHPQPLSPEGRGEQAPPSPFGKSCSICGEPAVGACVKCGSWYCVEHRGVEALPDEPFEPGEEGPRICWNCRLSSSARTVLFWTIVTAVCLAALICFLSLWA